MGETETLDYTDQILRMHEKILGDVSSPLYSSFSFIKSTDRRLSITASHTPAISRNGRTKARRKALIQPRHPSTARPSSRRALDPLTLPWFPGPGTTPRPCERMLLHLHRSFQRPFSPTTNTTRTTSTSTGKGIVFPNGLS